MFKGGQLVGIVSDRDLELVAGLNDVNPDTTSVRKAMTQVPYDVSPSTPLSQVVTTMVIHKYGSAIVTEHGHVVGIFTTHDALKLLAKDF
ncbi:MAG: CBS domain-containing protein [Polyangiales bacterium]